MARVTLVTESKRDYKAEYKKFQSSPKAKKYRAELNKYNRQKGTYGNGDGKDASHKGGKIVGFEAESKNRGRAEKSRLKKEINDYVGSVIDETLNENPAAIAAAQRMVVQSKGKKISVNTARGSRYKDKDPAAHKKAKSMFSRLLDKFRKKNESQMFLQMAKQLKEADESIDEIKVWDLNEKCWKGYEKKGMKTMFGKRYPNCVKKKKSESVNEVSDKQKRKIYKKAFGKEYDDPKRKQSPLPLDIAYKVALNKLKKKKSESVNEAKYKGYDYKRQKRKDGLSLIVPALRKTFSNMKDLKKYIDKHGTMESVNEQSKVIKSIDNLAKKNKYGTVTGTQMNGKTANTIMKIYNHPKMKRLGRQKDLDNMTSDELVNLTIDRDVIRILGLNEAVYKFRGYTNTQMDELDALLARAGYKGTPDFNKMTWTTKDRNPKIAKIIKSKGGKKIKESVNEAPVFKYQGPVHKNTKEAMKWARTQNFKKDYGVVKVKGGHKVIVQESINENISDSQKFKIYNSLKKGDIVSIKYDSSIAKGSKFHPFLVTKGKTKLMKGKVERIIMVPAGGSKAKRYLYNRNGRISLALGDLAAVIVDMKKGEVNEGTCGYGEDGKLGEEPAGPHLLKKKKKKNEIATRNRKHLNKFSKSQLDTLRKQYGTVKGVNPSSPTYKKLVYMLDSLPLANLKQLEKAKIPFISGLARNRVYRAKKFGSTTGG